MNSTKSNAKINLSLKIVGKRPDNYHTLESIFVPILDFYDTLSIDFESEAGIKIECNLTELANDRNLAAVAAGKYAQAARIAPHWTIKIEKNIPTGGGLGGGSSNAAFTLRLLNDFYRKLSEAELAECALTIGADVPFFLQNRPALCRGIGEIIEPLNFQTEIYLVLIIPDFPVSTPWAYRHAGAYQRRTNRIRMVIENLQNRKIKEAAGLLQNDFESAVFEKFPIYEIIRQTVLYNDGLNFNLSGSGSTAFALAENPEKLEILYRALNAKFQHEAIFIKKEILKL